MKNDFLETAKKQFDYYKLLGEKTFDQLNEEQLFYMYNEDSNSIGVIVKHLHGNMLSRWTNFLTEDGEKPWRQRDDEFEIHQYSKQQIINLWQKGWDCFLLALESLQEDDLLKTIYIRQEPLTVADAINRQLAHYPYHIGQIVFIGKMIRNENWKSLSIPKNRSQVYIDSNEVKDPAKKY